MKTKLIIIANVVRHVPKQTAPLFIQLFLSILNRNAVNAGRERKKNHFKYDVYRVS